MSVRAKFVVQSITRSKGWNPGISEVQTIKLTPVTSGSEENKSFFAATDIRIENLECITHAELMARNTIHNLPKPLAQTIQLLGALKRQINKKEKKHEKQD